RSDFVGVMRQTLETLTGTTCLFLQGAAGNINPVEMRHSLEPARRLGIMLGGEVAKVFEGTSTAAAEAKVVIESRRADLPAMTYRSMEEGDRAVANLRAHVQQLEAQSGNESGLWWAKNRMRQGEARLDSLTTG